MSPSPRRRGGVHALSDMSRRRRQSIPIIQSFLAQQAALSSSTSEVHEEIPDLSNAPIPELEMVATGASREVAPSLPTEPTKPRDPLREYLANGGDVTLRTSRPMKVVESLEDVEIRPALSILETIFDRPSKGRRWDRRSGEEIAPFPGEYSGLNAIRQILHSEDPAIWMFLGDDVNLSIQKGHQDPAAYHRMFADRLRQELYRGDDLALAQGGPKADVNQHLRNWPRLNRRFQPKVVFYMPTMADLDLFRPMPQSYLSELRELIQAVQASGVQFVLQSTWLFSRKHDFHRLSYAMAEDLRQLSSELDIPFIDHHHRWELANRTLNTERWLDRKRVAPDHIGQIALAMELFHELDLFEQQSLICNQERLLIC